MKIRKKNNTVSFLGSVQPLSLTSCVWFIEESLKKKSKQINKKQKPIRELMEVNI